MAFLYIVGEGDKPVSVLYHAEYHYIVSDRNVFVLFEDLVIPRDRAAFLTYYLHEPDLIDPPANLMSNRRLLVTDDVFKSAKFADIMEERKDPENDFPCTYQGSFHEDALEINRSYPSVAHSISKPVEITGKTGKEKGRLIIGHPVRIPRLRVNTSKQPSRVREIQLNILNNQMWEKDDVYGIRFGVYMGWPEPVASSLRPWFRNYFGIGSLADRIIIQPKQYHIHLWRKPDEQGLPSHPGAQHSEIFLQQPEGSLDKLIRVLISDQDRISFENPGPHSTIWVVMSSNCEPVEPKACGFERPSLHADFLGLTKYRPFNASAYRWRVTSWPDNEGTLFLKEREGPRIRLPIRKRTGFSRVLRYAVWPIVFTNFAYALFSLLLESLGVPNRSVWLLGLLVLVLVMSALVVYVFFRRLENGV